MSWHVDAVLYAPYEDEEAILAPFFSASRAEGRSDPDEPQGAPNAGLAPMVCEQRLTSSPTTRGVYGAQFNHVLPDDLVRHLKRIPWRWPEMVLLVLRVEGADALRTWQPNPGGSSHV